MYILNNQGEKSDRGDKNLSQGFNISFWESFELIYKHNSDLMWLLMTFKVKLHIYNFRLHNLITHTKFQYDQLSNGTGTSCKQTSCKRIFARKFWQRAFWQRSILANFASDHFHKFLSCKEAFLQIGNFSRLKFARLNFAMLKFATFNFAKINFAWLKFRKNNFAQGASFI